MDKPFSLACERNREPILQVLKEIISRDDRKLLEVGSGTGQHAVYFAPHFTHLIWVTSDVKKNHDGIKMWLAESGAPNIIGPGEYEVGKNEFPNGDFDIVFTANTFHIMPWNECEILMKDLGLNLKEESRVLIYGPFNYQGHFTSPSNAEFDQHLKSRNPAMGIRNFEDVVTAMSKKGFSFLNDYEMPANNRLISFKKDKLIQ
jgi:cyclopropane fatty-acyl-phospholipid synthase-like methyltransferase